jgi:hypothetical protein
MSGAAIEIPLVPAPQVLLAQLGATLYTLRLRWCDVTMGGWVLDISDSADNPLVCGVPLVTGADLLEQYAYLGLAGQLFCYTDGNLSATPNFANLGSQSHLVFLPN